MKKTYLKLYTSKEVNFEHNGLGILKDATNYKVTEERNGDFTLEFDYPINSRLSSELIGGNIVKANASDDLKGQLFRIWSTKKVHKGMISVYARHISFDLATDYIKALNVKSQPCEYVLNELFRNSQKSKHYRGYSDIQMLGNYSIERTKLLECIAGKEGSIIDTFGNGADILRDNTNIHILQRRGKDRNVLIAYKKNLTGFELEEDFDSMVTRAYTFAKYTNEKQEEVIVEAENGGFVDSPRIANYDDVYIGEFDFSDKFEDNNIPTPSKLKKLAEDKYNDSKCDIPKLTYKISFVALSSVEGREELKNLDRIGMGDKVLIRNSMYNISDEARVIKATYDPVLNKYISLELGEPKTTLGNLINNSNNDYVTKDEIKDIVNSNQTINYPNTLPNTPLVEGESYFASISLSWTFENKSYYTYEVYGSQIKGFEPNDFDLLFKGQASSYLFSSEPNQTWYFRVRAINTHGRATEFSNELEVRTFKIGDSTQYFEEAAIKDATIGNLRFDRGWVGQLKGNHIDAKLLTVTDGNGKRTFHIDDFGDINADFKTFKLNSVDISETLSGYGNRITNAEQKITSDAIVNTVTSSTSWKNKGDISRIRLKINYSNLTNESPGEMFLYGVDDNGKDLSNGTVKASLSGKDYNIPIEQHNPCYEGLDVPLNQTIYLCYCTGYKEVFSCWSTKNGWKKLRTSSSKMQDSNNKIEGMEWGTYHVIASYIMSEKEIIKSAIIYDTPIKDLSGMASNAELKILSDEINLKVEKGGIVSAINLSSEAVKIKSNKIQLEGAVSVGDSDGNYVHIDNANYTIRDSGTPKAFFGFKKMDNSGYDKYVVPKLAMGAYGYKSTHNYFTIVPYRGNDNPQGVSNAYVDIAYHNLSNDDFSNIKMYDGGDIRLAPIKNLEITTNYSNGSYAGTGENRLAVFSTSALDDYNSNLQIGVIANHSNGNGLILIDRGKDSPWEGSGLPANGSSWRTAVRVNTDSSGNKFFRPLDNKGDIYNGSSGYPWKSVHAKTTYSSDGIAVRNVSVNRNVVYTDDVLDNINFINTLRSNELVMDVTNLQGSNYVDVHEDNAYINNTEMIKLLILEIKKLKENVNGYKC